jgi:hypothetical protein
MMDWVRYGVIKGLACENSLGANPWHYGFVGGTDNHNALMANIAAKAGGKMTRKYRLKKQIFTGYKIVFKEAPSS